ncbi:30S ribosomal protein S9 [Candidatus Termititenax persephonae]|uniref:Small ribosomal subunit protein uS9 n=1 Tax=Candidatus Termititenax persephonae TaxID=2218525 RepID=A0A388THF6_9BACT|nr:30S ribosomal protein S9 [Candidatus Termititenax persephonae]
MSETKTVKKIVKKTVKEAEAKKINSAYVKGIQHSAYGKRKNATARVVLRPGGGKFLINDRHDLAAYFGNRQTVFAQVAKPFKVAELENQYDVFANLHGGGKFGQAGALAHAIAKTIVVINPELKKRLKDEGLLTRDSRVKETKKYGRKKARKGYTYRKR